MNYKIICTIFGCVLVTNQLKTASCRIVTPGLIREGFEHYII